MDNRFETVNLSYLDEISGGDVCFQKELIGIFLNQIPDFLSNMHEFLLTNQAGQLAKEAHTAKSSVLIFMMDKTGIYLKQIQLFAEQNQMNKIPVLLGMVETTLESAKKELSLYLDSLSELSDVKHGKASGW